MNNIIRAAAVVLCITASSCTSVFYQVYEVKPAGEATTNPSGALVYEKDMCRITYDFWLDGGDAGFTFYNGTDKQAVIMLDECYYIVNGRANCYYMGRTLHGNPYYNGAKELYSSATCAEQKKLTVPPKTSVSVCTYGITGSLYYQIDYPIYPRGRIKPLTFDKRTSPIVFSNIITYSIADAAPVKVSNEFFVSEIVNMRSTDIIETTYRNNVYSSSFRNRSPSKFYIKYIKLED